MILILETLWCCSPGMDAVIIWLLLCLSGADDFNIGDPVVLFSWGGCRHNMVVTMCVRCQNIVLYGGCILLPPPPPV